MNQTQQESDVQQGTGFTLDPRVLELVVCPRDRTTLRLSASSLICEIDHRYGVVDGIPILLLEEKPQTHIEGTRSLEAAAGKVSGDFVSNPDSAQVHPWVNREIAATNGMLFRSVIGKLTEYPIPELRLPPGEGRVFLEVGCSWGRWCVAAARAGYQPIGIDPSLKGVRTARDVACQLGIDALFMVADGRHLPFRDQFFDQVFSYSVLQHLAKEDVRLVLQDIRRVLRIGGSALVQMANAFGMRSLYHQARRGFRKTRGFEVRYWSLPELQTAFAELIGPSEVLVDGYLTLNPQLSEARLLPLRYRTVVYFSEVLRQLSKVFGPLKYVADSLYVLARREL